MPDKRTGKRSQLHLDLYADNQKEEVSRLISIGAKPYPWRYKPGDDFVVPEDPDGNIILYSQDIIHFLYNYIPNHAKQHPQKL